MRQGELTAAAQRETDHQRWADDGGHTPDPVPTQPVAPAITRSPWAAVRTALALGFAAGWLTGRR